MYLLNRKSLERREMETTYQVTCDRLLLRNDIPTFAEARQFASGRFGIMLGANPDKVYLITKRDKLADYTTVYTIMGTVDSKGFHHDSNPGVGK